MVEVEFKWWIIDDLTTGFHQTDLLKNVKVLEMISPPTVLQYVYTAYPNSKYHTKIYYANISLFYIFNLPVIYTVKTNMRREVNLYLLYLS